MHRLHVLRYVGSPQNHQIFKLQSKAFCMSVLSHGSGTRRDRKGKKWCFLEGKGVKDIKDSFGVSLYSETSKAGIIMWNYMKLPVLLGPCIHRILKRLRHAFLLVKTIHWKCPFKLLSLPVRS